jgi:Leucine-rich repeat (LRR) protein
MAPSLSISMVLVAWSTSVLFYGTYFDSAIPFVGASESSALQLEAKALLESGWWGSANTNNVSSRCKWPGITCNAGGSVTDIAIELGGFYLGEMSKLNLSSFPNLVRLDLHGTGLQGSIPVEIGTLLKLTYLDLSGNNLKGALPLSLTNLTQLMVLNVSHNQITGPIPSSLSLLIRLTDFVLYYNRINGSIPSEIGKLRYLVTLT